MAKNTNKKQLACWVSREVFERVKELTDGENPPFESVSEYLYGLIMADLGRRDAGVDAATYQLMTVLKDPEIRAEFKKLLKD